MNKTAALGLALVLVIVAGALLLEERSWSFTPWAARGKAQGGAMHRGTAPASVASAPAGTGSSQPSFRSGGSSLTEKLLRSNDWKDLFDKLDDPSLGPASERMRYQAMILERCSQYAELANTPEGKAAASIDTGAWKQLREFIGGLAKDPRQKSAIDYTVSRNVMNVCRGFAGVPIAPQQVEMLFMRAAAAGDPAGIARMISRRLADSSANRTQELSAEDLTMFAKLNEKPTGFPDPLSAEEQRQLQDAMFSGDPVAILAAGDVLSSDSDKQSFVFGRDQAELGPWRQQIWELAACQFGFECGTENLEVAYACAQLGRCADDYAGYLARYVLTPDDFARSQALATAIADAIRRHDYSAFQVLPKPSRSRAAFSKPVPLRIH